MSKAGSRARISRSARAASPSVCSESTASCGALTWGGRAAGSKVSSAPPGGLRSALRLCCKCRARRGTCPAPCTAPCSQARRPRRPAGRSAPAVSRAAPPLCSYAHAPVPLRPAPRRSRRSGRGAGAHLDAVHQRRVGRLPALADALRGLAPLGHHRVGPQVQAPHAREQRVPAQLRGRAEAEEEQGGRRVADRVQRRWGCGAVAAGLLATACHSIARHRVPAAAPQTPARAPCCASPPTAAASRWRRAAGRPQARRCWRSAPLPPWAPRRAAPTAAPPPTARFASGRGSDGQAVGRRAHPSTQHGMAAARRTAASRARRAAGAPLHAAGLHAAGSSRPGAYCQQQAPAPAPRA